MIKIAQKIRKLRIHQPNREKGLNVGLIFMSGGVLFIILSGFLYAETMAFSPAKVVVFNQPSLRYIRRPNTDRVIRSRFITSTLPLPENRWLLHIEEKSTTYNAPLSAFVQTDDKKDLKVTGKESRFYLALIKEGDSIVRLNPYRENKNSFGAGLVDLFTLPVYPECLYGVLDIENRKIFCFDVNLEQTQTLDVPLDWVHQVISRYGEYGPELWVFGGRESVSPSGKAKKGMDYWYRFHVEKGKKFRESSVMGSIYRFDEKQWLDIPVSPAGILARCEKVLRSKLNQNVHLDLTSATWTPVKATNDLNIDVIFEATEKFRGTQPPADIPEDQWHQGRRFFFLVRLNSTGIAEVHPLNFEIQFWNQPRVELDSEKGILHMPHYYLPRPDQQAFRLQKDGILLHFVVHTAFRPDVETIEDTRLIRVEGVETLIYFPTPLQHPHFFAIEELENIAFQSKRKLLSDPKKERFAFGSFVGVRPDRYIYFSSYIKRLLKIRWDREGHPWVDEVEISPAMIEFVLE